jgi:hypothetical protein
MTALAALPPARNPTTRPGRNVRLNRDANIEANLAQITGQVNVPECAHCARRNGVFALCVSAPDQLSGSCANCHYNNEGVRCSLREYSFWAVFTLFYNVTNYLQARELMRPLSPPPLPPPLPPTPILRPVLLPLPQLLPLLLPRPVVLAAGLLQRSFRAWETLRLLLLPRPLLLLLSWPLLLSLVPVVAVVDVVDVWLGLVVWLVSFPACIHYF